MSGLNWLIRDYVESLNGRIRFSSNIWLFVESAGKKKRLKMWNGSEWPDREDADGRRYSLFKGRAATCFHPTMWRGKFPFLNHDKRVSFTVPRAECEACEFHEPPKRFGSRKYACCKWFRANSGMDDPLTIIDNAVKQANELLK